jgi:hypothetical protein
MNQLAREIAHPGLIAGAQNKNPAAIAKLKSMTSEFEMLKERHKDELINNREMSKIASDDRRADRAQAAEERRAQAGRDAELRKPIGADVRKELEGAGTDFRTINSLVSGFDDKFGGFRIPGSPVGSDTYGDLANWAGRTSPLAKPEHKASAAWWQEYQGLLNKDRHELYGGALTATEFTEFRKSAVTPGMQPDMIRKNLARQHEIAKGAAARRGSYHAQFRPREEIEMVLGVPLEELGVKGDARLPNAPLPEKVGEKTRVAPNVTIKMVR